MGEKMQQLLNAGVFTPQQAEEVETTKRTAIEALTQAQIDTLIAVYQATGNISSNMI